MRVSGDVYTDLWNEVTSSSIEAYAAVLTNGAFIVALSLCTLFPPNRFGNKPRLESFRREDARVVGPINNGHQQWTHLSQPLLEVPQYRYLLYAGIKATERPLAK